MNQKKNPCDKIHDPNVIYLFKVNNENNRRCDMFQVNNRTLERCQLPRSDVFGNFEHISDIDFVFPLLTLSK